MRQDASINDLPNELLVMIFQFLYRMHLRQEIHSPLAAPANLEEFWVSDPFAPSAFPFAQAKVCQRWCTLLAHHPVYWTRIPITIGPTPTSLEDVANYFLWSQGLSVSVAVESQPHLPSLGNTDEKSRVAAVLPYISQYLSRIETIQFSLLHPTSIPDLRDWLVGQANILTSIILCLSHNGDTESTLNVSEGNANYEDNRDLRFSAPELSSLCIDSQTFARACSFSKTWLANAPHLTDMNLIPPGRRSRLEHLSIWTTIEVLSHASELRSLTVRGLSFANDDAPSRPLHSIGTTSLTLEDLGGTDAATFVRATGAVLADLTITNCSLLDLNNFFTGDLYLEALGEEHNLEELFTGLSAHLISLYNCPAFNNTIIDLMADGGLTGDDFPASAVSELALTECTNFDVENLYRMILTRRRAMEASPTWDGTVPGLSSGDLDELNAIVTLSVTDGPFLSASQRARFEQLVPEFEWTSSASDTAA